MNFNSGYSNGEPITYETQATNVRKYLTESDLHPELVTHLFRVLGAIVQDDQGVALDVCINLDLASTLGLPSCCVGTNCVWYSI